MRSARSITGAGLLVPLGQSFAASGSLASRRVGAG